MRAILAVLLLLMPAPLSAVEYTAPNGIIYRITDPPFQYRNYTGKVSVKELPTERLTEYCSRASGKYEDMACVFHRAGPLGEVCMVTIREGLAEDLHRAIVLHETAHCAGWPADHPVE